MTYPILEYDSTRLAFIEPSQVIQPRDVPEACVICFFQEVIDKVVAVHQAQRLVENRWEDGPHPICEIVYRGQRLAFFHPGIGAPLAAALLEEVIGFGCRKFIACGGCGVLQPDLAVGHLILVSGAVRDEGVSYHYLPPAREVIANEAGVRALTTILRQRGLPYQEGKTWTTDAPYRETPTKIAQRRAEGCLTVEMAAARFANDAALAYLSRALDLTPADAVDERYKLLCAREQIYELQGERNAQAANLATIEQLVAMSSDGRQGEVAVLKARYAVRTGDYAGAIV
jgi:uridine phosphorylase